MALALIPLSKLEEAINIINNNDLTELQIGFCQYFVSQWCNAKTSKQGPEIWNHHLSTIRTNNNAEGYHSMMSSTIPRHHPLVTQIVDFFLISIRIMKLKLNLTFLMIFREML